MTYSPLQLEAIRIFGRKDLSFGCMIKNNYDEIKIIIESDSFPYWKMKDGTIYNHRDFEILGHIPHLEDVFRVAEDKKKRITIEYYTQGPHLIINPIEVNLRNPERIEYNPTLPLLEQSEETLTQLINLFK